MNPLVNLQSTLIDGSYLKLSLTSPDYQKRTPLNLCIVVDVSKKFIQDIEKFAPEFQFSFEEVLTNALQPLLTPLSEQDTVSIVQLNTFLSSEPNQVSESVFCPKEMDEDNKKLAKEFLHSIKIQSENNNTLESLQRAFGLLSSSINNSKQNQSPVVILISDVRQSKKEKNPLESQNIINSLRELVQKNTVLDQVSINICGISENVDSYLLLDLAKEFTGQFVYLDDFSQPNKILSNVFANLITSFSTNILLRVELLNNLTFASVNPVCQLMPSTINKENNSIDISAGPIQYGQTRNIILKLSEPLNTTTTGIDAVAQVTVTVSLPSKNCVKSGQIQEIKIANLQTEKCLDELYRAIFVDFLFSNIKKYENGIQSYAISGLNRLLTTLESNSATSTYIADLAKLVKTHLDTTFSDQKLFLQNKNGLLSLARSHILQLESVSHPTLEKYRTKLQQYFINEIEEAHSKLPSPSPSPKKKNQREQDSFIKVKQFEMYEMYESTRI
ncbi:von willebrand factor type A domain protein (macronuclear) [Tetrahymena thermophila SB210]|uniref:von willebrand factor type A domain protein n=1 Tax=Tetrahymena thermophila (strain SB210) TaxID=312017 RepID=Q23S18_TETTS|nr:von willebrand factor type A domain protein [Tetrahymena thermophila SB210]EAR99329.1 von willebrand factor type A domain protein [Tetrahymena thermophila SB210]|eukprot:XP_001019574.1 von willebrand factor type A domain protein [Tetrahymena thermophila SB210]